MGKSTPSAEPREGKKSAKVLQVSCQGKPLHGWDLPTMQVQSSSWKKIGLSSTCYEVVGSSSQWQKQAAWKPPLCWPNFIRSSLSSSRGTTTLIKLAFFWQMNSEGVSVTLDTESGTESGAWLLFGCGLPFQTQNLTDHSWGVSSFQELSAVSVGQDGYLSFTRNP